MPSRVCMSLGCNRPAMWCGWCVNHCDGSEEHREHHGAHCSPECDATEEHMAAMEADAHRQVEEAEHE